MYQHYESIPQQNLEAFLRFEDRGSWELRQRLQFPVFRSTMSEVEEEEMQIRQTIKIHSVLVRQNDADQIEIEQPNRQWRQEIRQEGWRDPFRAFPARKPLVTTHDQLPARVTSEFINHFSMREKENNLVHDFEGDTIVTKNDNELGETVSINGHYLFDFLQDRGFSLVLGYYQGRQIKQPPHLDIDEGSVQGTERNGAFELSWFCRDEGAESQFWDSDYWWVGILNPDDYGLSKRQQDQRTLETTFFCNIDGNEFPAAEADHDERALSSVFFDVEILDQYRRRDDTTVKRWSEQGGYLTWKRYYGVRFYLNEYNEVYIPAKDLKSIPPSELQTWADHNIVPEGSLPEEAWKNYFEAEWVDSTAPHRTVIQHFQHLQNQLSEKFSGEYIAESLEFEPEKLQRPAIQEEDAFLDVINKYNKTYLESIKPGEIASLLQSQMTDAEWEAIEDDGGIQGSKQGLYELIKYFEDAQTAGRVLEPFNIIYDFRTYEDHRGAEDAKQRALDELCYSDDPEDYRDVFDDLVTLLEERLNEINQLVIDWS